eukprot:Nk52_evm22s147 gene=Nk52_evmTU22s147
MTSISDSSSSDGQEEEQKRKERERIQSKNSNNDKGETTTVPGVKKVGRMSDGLEGEGDSVPRRLRKGSRAEGFYGWKDISFEEMESSLAPLQILQQQQREFKRKLQQLHNNTTTKKKEGEEEEDSMEKEIDRLIDLLFELPCGTEEEEEEEEGGRGRGSSSNSNGKSNYNNNNSNNCTVDEDVWVYEHMRNFCLELEQFTSQLLEDVCGPEVSPMCESMQASSWQYLCAAHSRPQTCSAIEYTLHTLDQTGAILNSNALFPSRVSVPEKSVRQFQSICRRLYRIFAHAYFTHREVYDMWENETRLCARFQRFCELYQLVPDALLIIPGKRRRRSREAEKGAST